MPLPDSAYPLEVEKKAVRVYGKKESCSTEETLDWDVLSRIQVFP